VKRIIRKWRPPLWMVVGGTLGVVLWLPIIGILAMRAMGPTVGWDEALVTSALGVCLATVVLAWMLWRILLRPMRALRDRAAGVRAGAVDALDPLDHYGTSDMQALGQSVLDMGRALQGREAVLRGYADHVTHELKSPITVIRGAAELLASGDLPDAERVRLIEKIEAASDRMTALLDAQRSLARAQEPAARGRAMLSDVVAEAQAVLQVEVGQDGVVPLPHDVLALVLDHLTGNAAAHGASRVKVDWSDGCLTVTDNGPGISAGNRPMVFEPFFTTRRESGGTGMGLPIVRRMLEAHGAEIDAVPHEDGARFVIRF